MTVKYPEIEVELVGNDSNAFSIIGAVTRKLKKAKVSEDVVSEFRLEAMNGSYDDLLVTCMTWVSVV